MSYLDMVKKDVMNYIISEGIKWNEDSRYDVEQELYDDLFNADGITGNGSGSYTFNNYEARGYVLDDIETVKEAIEYFSISSDEIVEAFLSENWEYFDVTARCKVLYEAISDAMDELESTVYIDLKDLE